MEAEVLPTGSFTYAAGQAEAVELCSVSGCFPHILDYPQPPRGGTAVTGTVPVETGGALDDIVVTVPRSALGGPANGSLMESFSAYSFLRSKSAALPFTNAEGQAGVVPVMIDGICCSDITVGTGTDAKS